MLCIIYDVLYMHMSRLHGASPLIPKGADDQHEAAWEGGQKIPLQFKEGTQGCQSHFFCRVINTNLLQQPEQPGGCCLIPGGISQAGARPARVAISCPALCAQGGAGAVLLETRQDPAWALMPRRSQQEKARSEEFIWVWPSQKGEADT